jgi:hypothetical protein
MIIRIACAASLVAVAARADIGDQLAKLLPEDGGEHSHFGAAVALDGHVAIVGMPFSADGAAYLFDAATGEQLAKLVPEDATPVDYFGIAVDISGSRAIVGTYGTYLKDENGVHLGAAYVFDVFSGRQLYKLINVEDSPGNSFGTSVAIDGDMAIVGAPGVEGHVSGAAFIFEVESGRQIAKLTPDDRPGDLFGQVVDISDEIAIVADTVCPGFCHPPPTATPTVYVFDATTGKTVAKLYSVDDTCSAFGWTASISGDHVLVGDCFGPSLFDAKTGARLSQLRPNDNPQTFGGAVSIFGEIAIVGAPADHDNGPLAGAAYLFDVGDALHPRQLAKLHANDGDRGDRLGGTVAVFGSSAVAGASGDDVNGPYSGSAYLFDASTCAADINGDGVLNILDFVCFQQQWQAMSPLGDCDDNEVFNILDFVCFQGEFVAGCP